MQVDDTQGRPLRKDAARNRALLIATARDVFARRGLEASLDDIARQAGVGVGTAYRHFGNKYDLAAAVMQESIATLVSHARTAAVAADPWAALVDFLETLLTFQTRDRGLREVLLGVRDPDSNAEVHDLLAEPVVRLLARAKEAGQVRHDVAVSDIGFVVLMLCQVADVAGEAGLGLWQRYLPSLLSGLRPEGPDLAGTAMSDDEYRTASTQYQTARVRGTRTSVAT